MLCLVWLTTLVNYASCIHFFINFFPLIFEFSNQVRILRKKYPSLDIEVSQPIYLSVTSCLLSQMHIFFMVVDTVDNWDFFPWLILNLLKLSNFTLLCSRLLFKTKNSGLLFISCCLSTFNFLYIQVSHQNLPFNSISKC